MKINKLRTKVAELGNQWDSIFGFIGLNPHQKREVLSPFLKAAIEEEKSVQQSLEIFNILNEAGFVHSSKSLHFYPKSEVQDNQIRPSLRGGQTSSWMDKVTKLLVANINYINAENAGHKLENYTKKLLEAASNLNLKIESDYVGAILSIISEEKNKKNLQSNSNSGHFPKAQKSVSPLSSDTEIYDQKVIDVSLEQECDRFKSQLVKIYGDSSSQMDEQKGGIVKITREENLNKIMKNLKEDIRNIPKSLRQKCGISMEDFNNLENGIRIILTKSDPKASAQAYIKAMDETVRCFKQMVKKVFENRVVGTYQKLYNKESAPLIFRKDVSTLKKIENEPPKPARRHSFMV